MGQKGEHTWDIIIQYHRCPKCGNIIESRQGYEYRQGKYRKEVSCDHCHQHFTVIKSSEPSIGPLLGDPQPIESEWGDPR
jgi:hypothetical protein